LCNINKQNNGNYKIYKHNIGGCSGEENITEMWRKHFEQLYNSVDDDGFKFKMLFCDRLATTKTCSMSVTVQSVLDCVSKQKSGKAVGPDGIAMEAIINGGLQLAVHLCILLNLFLQAQHLPTSFMRSVVMSTLEVLRECAMQIYLLTLLTLSPL